MNKADFHHVSTVATSGLGPKSRKFQDWRCWGNSWGKPILPCSTSNVLLLSPLMAD
ncbi:MAG: hypothetical protein OXT71_02540 [Acidobacteriota bacterium]|nr:hypothetical protein [Acidobacteriota bacterium]